MSGNNSTTLLVLGIVFAPLLTYLVAARRLSGKIKNSEATELWAESRSIREWSTNQVKELNDHVDELEKRLVEVEHKNGELLEENKRLLREKHHLELLLEQEREFNSRLRWEAERSPRRRRTDGHFSEGGNGGDTGNEG